jgi:uncharacterized membrane protein YhiD involved in acid resistance
VNPLGFLEGLSSSGPTAFPASLVALDLGLAFVLGVVVAAMYSWTHRGMSYSRNMVHSIVLLTMIITMVMLVVGDSVARAFGLVGALAIIRFRTVVRDTRDTTFIFLSLAVGIAVGAHQPLIAILGTLFVGGAATLLQLTNFATRHADTGVLRVRGVPDSRSGVEALLGDWCATAELVASRQSSGGKESEFTWEVRLLEPTEREAFLAAVRGVDGVGQVTVAIEERAEEW